MNYDILIVGGGLVGASLALGLENRCPDLKVGLIDVTFQVQKADNRTIALSDISLKILQALSASPLNIFKTSPIEKIHISRQGRFAITRFKAADINLKALGYSVEMTTLVQTLYEQLHNTDCSLLEAQFKEATRVSDGWKITLEKESGITHLSTKLLIAADGEHSLLRKQLNITMTTHDYLQSAMVTTVETEKPLCHTAYERFIANGSIALLPIGEKKAKLVWIGSNETIKALMRMDATEKLFQLKQYMGSRLGDFLALGESCFVYPLKSQQTSHQIQEKFVLMGNAAHVLHPIAAQGFNLSLRDVAVLVDKLSDAENDFASMQVLQNYLMQRIGDQKRVEAFTHRLSLFSENYFFSSCLLLNLLEFLPFVKRQLIRFTMGSLVKIPRWVFNYE